MGVVNTCTLLASEHFFMTSFIPRSHQLLPPNRKIKKKRKENSTVFLTFLYGVQAPEVDPGCKKNIVRENFLTFPITNHGPSPFSIGL